MSVPKLFTNALSVASKSSNLPTIGDDAQELIGSCLKDLRTLWSRIAALSLFSTNESLEDIGTRDLVYLFVPYVLSEVQGRVRAIEMAERLYVLDQAQRYLKDFLSSVEKYNIVPEADRVLYRHKVSTIRDAKQRREAKIMQYQKEKELRARSETIRKRRGLRPTDADGGNDFDLISMLLPSGDRSRSSEEEEDLDSETEDALREATLVLLRLLYAQAQNHLENMEQERELLRNAPQAERKPEEDVHREGRRVSDENMWKLDAVQPIDRGLDGKGAFLDSGGKPLRPFTILPSEAANRARLQAQVFGPGHRLPTMTIDEYLEIEQQRGNIITGGGRASQEALTSTEKLIMAAEVGGTRESEEKAEELRQKQEKWAQFTDANPRGTGNTMNRG
ncbi:hypothetical protein AX15_006303 [Amanita polypyramis BW_CC]|nr:hypothetical protein AX15_006303 [Amanita polypyramis BW_CC]